MSDNLPPLPPACESLRKWTYDAADMRAYARAAIEADRVSRDVPDFSGGGLVAIKTLLSRDPRAHATTAIAMIDAMLAASHQPQPVQASGYGPKLVPQASGYDKPVQAQARTMLEQYDLEQSPEYRKGWDDGRLNGYEVGYRHGNEAHLFAQPKPANQHKD